MLVQRGWQVLSHLLSHYSKVVPNSPQYICRLASSWSGWRRRSYWRYLRRSVLGVPTPPYPRVTQTGDPVLRCHAAPVPPDQISHPDTVKVINRMVRVLRSGGCVGLSAPQLGVPLRILMLELPEKMSQAVPPDVLAAREMTPFPLKVFINPEMRVLDNRTLSFPEGCRSIHGFSAVVPRYYAVEISGLTPDGKRVTWLAKGWAARIVQHEMDHLDGVLYIDKMDPRTFTNINWTEVND
ncbi:peptide deformylase, mitochondrial [Pelobates cultripes]|uniref:Peptide deformylase n=1 Tax=Pelobates cultripes TaxID=61616 RepID=A0AAD1TGD0_PELCU|nr:peptide deformylase, mitochondrial [Pelobates cultripes]